VASGGYAHVYRVQSTYNNNREIAFKVAIPDNEDPLDYQLARKRFKKVSSRSATVLKFLCRYKWVTECNGS
jgi:hypothetical protein